MYIESFFIFRDKHIILLKNKNCKIIYLIENKKLHMLINFGNKKWLRSEIIAEKIKSYEKHTAKTVVWI